MAIWQYVIHLIPISALNSDGTVRGLTFADDSFDLPPLTLSISDDDLVAMVESHLAPSKSLHKHSRFWGNEVGDDVCMSYEDGRIHSVRIRLDLRNLERDRLAFVVELARRADCCFLEGRSFEVIAANEESLLESIRKSRPAQFLKDPEGFLRELGRNAQ